MRRLTLALLATVLAAPAVQAADLPAPLPVPAAWSMSIFSGATWLETVEDGPAELSYDTGFIVGGTLGYTPLDWVRTELEVAYSSSHGEASAFGFDFGSGYTDTLTVMGNAWFGFNMLPVVGGAVNDIGSGMGVSPYFGGGLGVGFLNPGDDSDTSLAWQVGAGVRWNFDTNVGLDVGYRYRNLVDVGDEFDLSSHNLIAGVTFNF
jgi:opacity protein-like surface antigen